MKKVINNMIYLMMIDSEDEKDHFAILYKKYKRLMLTVCFHILHDEHLAEDATHEAFIKLAKNMDKIGNIDSHETKRYLITIAKNSAIDLYRKCASQRLHEMDFDEMKQEGEASVYEDNDDHGNIVEILMHLPVLYRDVLLLKYSNCYSNKEIAKILQISEDNVRQRILRGKNLVKKKLEKEMTGNEKD